MALEKLLSGDGKKALAWDRDKFYNSITDSERLAKVDVSTAEGQKDYVDITGDKTIYDKQPDTAAYEHRLLAQEYGARSQIYASSHFDGEFGVLGDEDKLMFAISHAPQGTYSPDKPNEDDEAFEKASKDVSKWGGLYMLFKQQPELSVVNRLNELSELGKDAELAGVAEALSAAIQRDVGTAIQIYTNDAKSRALYALGTYGGSDKFVSETRKRVESSTREYKDKAGALEKQIADDFEAVKDKLQYAPVGEAAKVRAEIEAKYAENFKELGEAHPDAGLIDQMNKDVIPAAYQTIKAEKEQEAAKKAAKEAEKKKGEGSE